MLYFQLMLAMLTVHELDATYHAEWRLLPLLNKLEDHTARAVFVLAHIPIMVWVFDSMVTEAGHAEAGLFRLVFDAFSLIHLGLHVWLRNHPANRMNNWLSWIPIIGAGVFGVVDLVVLTM